ncbi:hypothetical protein ACFQEP_15095 [Lactococcus lactis subsp. hordniae]
MKIKNVLLGIVSLSTVGLAGMITTQASASTSNPVYRLYNKNTGEHFYTENTYEKKVLKMLVGMTKVWAGTQQLQERLFIVFIIQMHVGAIITIL